MSNNITTLILNLVISESRLHRQRIALHITDLLESVEVASESLQSIMKTHFVSRMMRYVVDPSARNKDVLFEAAKFYQTYFVEEQIVTMLAAA